MAQYVPKNRMLNVYVEHGQTRSHTYFMSLTKVVTEQLDDEPSLNLTTIRPKKMETGSCSKKLDKNITHRQKNTITSDIEYKKEKISRVEYHQKIILLILSQRD